MSCGIAYPKNEFPHHQPLGWKALISINLGDGILVQDCRRQHQEPQQVFKITAPSNRNNVHFICVVAGFGSHVDPRSAPTRQDKSHKNNSSTWRWETDRRNSIGEGGGGVMGGGVHKKAIQTHCKHSLFSVLAQPPSPPNCAQEPMRNLTEASTAKQNQQRQAPKGEIQNKICLRWTASPFNMLVRKFRKLKIVPPTRRQFF